MRVKGDNVNLNKTNYDKAFEHILNWKQKKIDDKKLKDQHFYDELEKLSKLPEDELDKIYVEAKVKHDFYQRVMLAFFVSVILAFLTGFLNTCIKMFIAVFQSTQFATEIEKMASIYSAILFGTLVVLLLFLILIFIFRRFNSVNKELNMVIIAREKKKR